MLEEPATAPRGAAPAQDWLAELAADPEAFAAYLSVGDRLMSFLDDELAWMQAHPPRPCSAQSHQAIVDRYGDLAAVWRETLSSLRAQDGDRFGQAYLEPESLEALEFPDPFSLGLTCWQLPELYPRAASAACGDHRSALRPLKTPGALIDPLHGP